MAASLLRRGTYNSRDIKFELEATMSVLEEEKAAMTKVGQKLEASPATKRLWHELQQEMIALEGLYVQATGEVYNRPQPVHEQEMRALQVLFEAMHGRRWKKKSGWLGRARTANTRGVPPFSCNPWCWDGLECGVRDIQAISMPGNQLQGILPGAALADLPSLIKLDLSDNEIEGTLPKELGRMTQLENLRLAVTKLEGPIPDTLGQMKGLRELNLSYAKLTGRIPGSIGTCVKLSLLNLSHNHLDGPIPPEICRLRGLRELSLGHNRLTGQIPPSFGELERLQSLSLSCNSLEGCLTPWFGKLTRLKVVLLDNNRLSGRLPKNLRNLGRVEVVHLQFNRLSGTIPRGVGELRELRVLNLAGNRLEGKVPPELGSVTKLVGLELGHNFIVGPLPVELGRLSCLLDLHVLDGCPSYSLPLRRGFTRHAFERVFVTGPALGLNNTTYPSGEIGREGLVSPLDSPVSGSETWGGEQDKGAPQ